MARKKSSRRMAAEQMAADARNERMVASRRRQIENSITDEERLNIRKTMDSMDSLGRFLRLASDRLNARKEESRRALGDILLSSGFQRMPSRYRDGAVALVHENILGMVDKMGLEGIERGACIEILAAAASGRKMAGFCEIALRLEDNERIEVPGDSLDEKAQCIERIASVLCPKLQEAKFILPDDFDIKEKPVFEGKREHPVFSSIQCSGAQPVAEGLVRFEVSPAARRFLLNARESMFSKAAQEPQATTRIPPRELLQKGFRQIGCTFAHPLTPFIHECVFDALKAAGFTPLEFGVARMVLAAAASGVDEAEYLDFSYKLDMYQPLYKLKIDLDKRPAFLGEVARHIAPKLLAMEITLPVWADESSNPAFEGRRRHRVFASIACMQELGKIAFKTTAAAKPFLLASRDYLADDDCWDDSCFMKDED